MQNLVAAINNVAFPGDEHILTLGEENLFGLSRPVGKTKKLEIDGRRRGRALRDRDPAASGLS